MKERAMLVCLVLTAALALADAEGAGTAQGETVYPALEEPSHKPVFHNAFIDVYDVQLKPGQRSFYHRHSRDQLGIALRSGTSLNQALGGDETPTAVERGAISYIPHSALGGYTHRVRAGTGPFRVIGIEFAAPARAGTDRAVASPDQRVLTFPQGRMTRLAIAPGQSTAITGSLIVAASSGSMKPAGKRSWVFDEGAVRWIGDSGSGIYANRSRRPVDLLILALDPASGGR